MADKEKLVVIGGGMAATVFLEELTDLDAGRYDITLFSGEKHPGYNRVLLAQILTGEKSVDDILVHGDDWYIERGIRLVCGSMVKEIKRARREVVGEDGLSTTYRKLVLATGSLPVILPVPGKDLPGVVAFRNIGDCEKIRGAVEEGKKRVVVIGGGLLGLEAAWAIGRMGADVTVVHLEERLMERQLDAAAAAFLREDIEKEGINILLGRRTVEIRGRERVEAIKFSDGSALEADLVVMCVGIRPNASLARAAGIYCERGIVVSDTMQTYDPSVYAIGECVEHRKKTFGLVADVFEQAKVLANHLAGDCRLVFSKRPSSTALKIPTINLYSAGRVADAADSIEYRDGKRRVYKKVFLKDEKLEGIILYGETSLGPALFTRLLSGEDVSEKRGSLLFGAPPAGKEAASVDELPDDAVVCGCSGVRKGALVKAIEEEGLFTLDDVKRKTKASTSCGGCTSLVERILESVLGSAYSPGGPGGICPCTTYTREDIIKNIRQKELKSVTEVMETLGWETVGCETCRPAVNYYVSMVWPGAAEDDPGSRIINERLHANIQKDGTFSVVPRVYGGVVTPAELRRIAGAAEKFNVPLVKITGGQRIALLGVKREDLGEIWREIDMPSGYAYGKAIRTVKTCVGEKYCRYGTQDSTTLGIELERRLEGLWTPAKVKMGVSGCPRNCAETRVKDVGINGVGGGWEIYIGGSCGIELRAGELLCALKTAGEVIEITMAIIQKYREEANYGERLFKWLDRAGMKAVKKAAVEDGVEREALIERLEKALSVRRDPWKAAVGISTLNG